MAAHPAAHPHWHKISLQCQKELTELLHHVLLEILVAVAVAVVGVAEVAAVAAAVPVVVEVLLLLHSLQLQLLPFPVLKLSWRGESHGPVGGEASPVLLVQVGLLVAGYQRPQPERHQGLGGVQTPRVGLVKAPLPAARAPPAKVHEVVCNAIRNII